MIWKERVLIGVVSTLTMDALSAIAYRLRLTAPLPPNLVGRWFASIARAHPLHADIALAAPGSREIAIALPVHYAIGVTLASLYIWCLSRLGWPLRGLGTAMAFGLFTNVFPWLLMFPAMGFGAFGTNGPPGTRLFSSSLISHGFYGIGIWVGVRIVGLW